MEPGEYIRTETRGDIAICYPAGEIDLYTSPSLRKQLHKIADQKKKILISFRDVSYIDSSGLATLVELYQRLKKLKGEIILAEMEASVKGTFELSRLERVFKILPSIKEAIAGFSG